MSRKIAIVGKAPSSYLMAPFADESWEIWTINDVRSQQGITRWTRHYEVHPLSELRASDAVQNLKDYYVWLQELTDEQQGRVWLGRADDEFPLANVYPLEDIRAKWGHLCGGMYFTNSISELIAHALLEGCDEMALYGVDMAQSTEYSGQRPSAEYWCGAVEFSGVKLTIPKESDLLKCRHIYALEDATPLEILIATRERELYARQEQYRQALALSENDGFTAIGRINTLAELQTVLNGEAEPLLAERMEDARKHLEHATVKKDEALKHFHIFTGAIDDLQYFKQQV